ncbi:hypothetical protein Tco_0690718 [Tanacetum coccineum]
MQSAFLTQGTVSNIPIVFSWSDSIRPEGFLSSVLLWLVIIVAVVGVGVTSEVKIHLPSSGLSVPGKNISYQSFLNQSIGESCSCLLIPIGYAQRISPVKAYLQFAHIQLDKTSRAFRTLWKVDSVGSHEFSLLATDFLATASSLGLVVLSVFAIVSGFVLPKLRGNLIDGKSISSESNSYVTQPGVGGDEYKGVTRPNLVAKGGDGGAWLLAYDMVVIS